MFVCEIQMSLHFANWCFKLGITPVSEMNIKHESIFIHAYHEDFLIPHSLPPAKFFSPKTACDFRKGSAGHAAASCIFQGIQGPMMASLTVHPKTCGIRWFPMISTDLAIGHIWEHCKNLFPGRSSRKAGCAWTMFVLLSSETDLFGVLCGECWDQVWIERHAVRREFFFPTDTLKLNFCSLEMSPDGLWFMYIVTIRW